jgi:6-phosphogluconolactonase (cycloisomerase 2 family)
VIASVGPPAGTGHRPLAAVLSIGPRLIQFQVDVDGATLRERSALELEENVQYAWPHASGDYLYVATSNGGPDGTRNDRHEAHVLRLHPLTRALAHHQGPIPLPARPVHITTDERCAHVLVAYNRPSGLTVHRIGDDARWGERIAQSPELDFGIYAHQVRLTPGDRSVILVTRGNSATATRPEEPGALEVFAFRDGMLASQACVAPGGGVGFGPRHVDVHSRLPWLFASLERQNLLQVFALSADGGVAATPSHSVETLADPAHPRHRQLAGAIHFHPNGRFVYVANRALGLTDVDGRRVSIGGETTIAVYAVDAASGQPMKIQDVDTRGGSPRTFALDPSGRLMLVANSTPLTTHEDGAFTTTPPNVALFRVAEDGRLQFERRYEFPQADRPMLWTGVVA